MLSARLRESTVIEALSSLSIIVISAALLGYWFRWMCLLILCTKTIRGHAGEVATAHRLNFIRVRRRLHDGAIVDLDHLRELLDRDYALLLGLIGQGRRQSANTLLGHRTLRIDYQLLAFWCRVSRRFVALAARWALEEMSLVLEYFANAIGEAASVSAGGN